MKNWHCDHIRSTLKGIRSEWQFLFWLWKRKMSMRSYSFQFEGNQEGISLLSIVPTVRWRCHCGRSSLSHGSQWQACSQYHVIDIIQWRVCRCVKLRTHWDNYVFISFQIEWNMIVVTVFHFDFEPIRIPFGSKSKGKLSPRLYLIQCGRKWKYNFLSVVNRSTHTW